MKLVSGINTSGIFSHSGLSAEIATKDSLGNVIKDTYLSAVPDGYLTKSSADGLYQPKGDYTTTAEMDYVSGVIDTNSGVFSGAIDYISGQMPTAFGDMLESNLDSETHWDSESNEFNVLTGYNGSSFGMGSFYITDYDEIRKDDGDAIININSTGINFRNPDGGYSNQSGDYAGGYWSIGSDNSNARLDANANFYGSPEITFIDDNNNTADITMSSISAWNDTKTTVETNSASWGGGTTYTGDAQGALDEVYSNSGTWNTVTNKLDTTAFSDVSGTFLTAHQPISASEWNSVYDTVSSNSASWTGGGGSIDTLPFFVQEPLTTGISGSSAYIALTGGTDNSAYIPYSAISTKDGYGLISYINGSAIYSDHSDFAEYSNTAYYDQNGNTITSYYQTTLTFGVSDNTITSINNTAVGGGGGTPTATLELSAGNYITITDDTANSASILSVSGLATTTEMNYVSGVIGDVETLLASL